MKVNNLISVGSPVRKDMKAIVKLARPNIKFWLHISDTKWDTWSFAGTLTDNWLFHKDLRHPEADINDQVPGIGHSKILYDPSFHHLWIDNGWLERLKYGYGGND
jgi:hypothetical protein